MHLGMCLPALQSRGLDTAQVRILSIKLNELTAHI